MNKYKLRYVLIGLLIFLSIGALYGGVLLILSPSGELLGIPISNLKYPFSDYLIPGLFLLIVLGLAPIIISIGLINKFNSKIGKFLSINKKYHWSLNFSAYLGIILMLFEIIQVSYFMPVSFLHALYFLIGIIIIILSSIKNIKEFYIFSSVSNQ